HRSAVRRLEPAGGGDLGRSGVLHPDRRVGNGNGWLGLASQATHVLQLRPVAPAEGQLLAAARSGHGTDRGTRVAHSWREHINATDDFRTQTKYSRATFRSLSLRDVGAVV